LWPNSLFYCGLLTICYRVRAVHGWTKWSPSVVLVLIGNDGCRCVAFLPDSCHTLRHVSGVRFVRLGWIPALRSDVRLCIPLHSWSKSNFSLGQVSGFLCCVPTVKAFACPIVPRSSCVLPLGARHGMNFEAFSVAHGTLVVSLVHGVSLELSVAERVGGIGPHGLFVAQISVRR
jgi:hypothetical protein